MVGYGGSEEENWLRINDTDVNKILLSPCSTVVALSSRYRITDNNWSAQADSPSSFAGSGRMYFHIVSSTSCL